MSGSRKLVEIPLSHIRVSPYNPRHEQHGIPELAQSIRSFGVLEPLLVSPVIYEPPFVTLTAGSRRFAAAQMAGLATVPCLLLPAKLNERGQRSISLIENLHRRDMTHIETGEAFLALQKTGLTIRQIAQHTGVTEPTVYNKIRIVSELCAEVQTHVHKGNIRMSEAMTLCRLNFDEQRAYILKGGSRSHTPQARKQRISSAQASLEGALRHYRKGSVDLALAEARRAVQHLEHETKQGAATG